MTDSTERGADIEEFGELVARLSDAAGRIVAHGRAADVPAEQIAEPLYVAARLLSAKTDANGRTPWPIDTDALTATETVVLVTALLEAADINLFDMAIWYRRPS